VKLFKKEVPELKEGEEGTICFQEQNSLIAKNVQIVFYDENN
jgi:catabolite regulation protein CreA